MARPKGSKNRATIVREEQELKVLKQCHGLMLRDIYDVLEAVQKRAIEGDMQAAKLILDRVVPAKRSIDEDRKGPLNIQINIVGDNHENEHSRQGATELVESGSTNGKVYVHAQGGEVSTEHAGEEG